VVVHFHNYCSFPFLVLQFDIIFVKYTSLKAQDAYILRSIACTLNNYFIPEGKVN
jgi:hypothetical protein